MYDMANSISIYEADVVAMVIATAASAPMNNSLFTWKSTKTNFSTN